VVGGYAQAYFPFRSTKKVPPPVAHICFILVTEIFSASNEVAKKAAPIIASTSICVMRTKNLGIAASESLLS
jgi:hypothetical protein